MASRCFCFTHNHSLLVANLSINCRNGACLSFCSFYKRKNQKVYCFKRILRFSLPIFCVCVYLYLCLLVNICMWLYLYPCVFSCVIRNLVFVKLFNNRPIVVNLQKAAKPWSSHLWLLCLNRFIPYRHQIVQQISSLFLLYYTSKLLRKFLNVINLS